METAQYISEFLKFIAAPLAILELFDGESRKRIEGKIIAFVKSAFKTSLLLSVTTFLGFYLVVYSAPYLFLAYMSLPIFIGILFFLISIDRYAQSILVIHGLSIVVFLFAVVSWLAPDAWIIALFAPAKWTLFLIKDNIEIISIAVPAFDPEIFIIQYRASVNEIEVSAINFLEILSYVTPLYFWFSDGIVFLALFLLQSMLFIFIFSALFFPFFGLFSLLTVFSEYLKRKFDETEKGILPLGAFVIWFIGEVMSFFINTCKYFA